MIELHPRSAELWLLEGGFFGRIERYEEALNCFNKALEVM
jgi:tetratricopeptide (TPR) repeat protein